MFVELSYSEWMNVSIIIKIHVQIYRNRKRRAQAEKNNLNCSINASLMSIHIAALYTGNDSYINFRIVRIVYRSTTAANSKAKNKLYYYYFRFDNEKVFYSFFTVANPHYNSYGIYLNITIAIETRGRCYFTHLFIFLALLLCGWSSFSYCVQKIYRIADSFMVRWSWFDV